MAFTARTESPAIRVLNILESINHALGKSGAMILVERAHRSPVPAALARTYSRFSLRFLAEAKRWDADLTPEEAAKRKAKEVAGRGRLVKQKKRAAEIYQAGKGKATKKKKKKSKKEGPPVDGGDDAPTPPAAPGAGAQAVAAGSGFEGKRPKKPAWLGRPTAGPARDKPSSIPDDDAVAARIKDKLKGVRKSRAKAVTGIEDPADVYKTPSGRRQGRKAGLQRMAKRREAGKVGSGEVDVSAGASVHDKIDALHDMIRKLTQHVTQGRESVRSIRTSPGRRWDTAQHPEDEPDVDPQAFARHQERRRADLDWQERERQRRGTGRSLGARGGPKRDYHGYAAHDRQADYEPAALRSKVSKLRRAKEKDPGTRDRAHDTAKGHFIRTREEDPDTKRVSITGEHPEHEKLAGHYKDPGTGKPVHGSGNKDNKKFANATTFRSSDDDAMLHTDKDEEGSRGSADDDEFAVVGNTSEDPRKKYYRVSKEGGYASAMASLNKGYRKGGDTKEKVIDKVRSTGFVDRKGHQIDVRPTGDIHTQRAKCDGAAGEALKSRDAKEHYRLCKGSHDGPGGTVKGRSEYDQGFDPQHDDKGKLKSRHKSAEKGKKWSRRD